MKQEATTWNLDDVVKLSEFDTLYAQTENDIKKFADFFAGMTPDMSTEAFVEFNTHHEATVANLYRLGCRPALMESTDKTDSLALKLKNKVKDVEVLFSEAVQPISLWLKGKQVADKPVLDDTNAARLFASIPDLTYVFAYSRLMGRYSLDEKSENIMMAKDANGVRVVTDLRDVFETEFEYRFAPKGGKAKTIKNSAELTAYTSSPKAEERKAAFEARFSQYSKHIDKFFIIYQAVVKDWAYETKLRGFDSAISMRNVANHLHDDVITTLMEVCGQNTEVFQRYFRFKAQALGTEKLSRYDLYAPLGETAQTISYADAQKMTLEAFTSFSPNFAGKAQEIITGKHIDSHPASTKRGGAFCMTVGPAITPYVMLNYADKFRDVSTLAHELGHGVHSLYANGHSISSQHANLPLSETASTFGEMILFEKLLGETSDPALQKQLLSEKLSDSYATICRQNFIVKFELAAHQALAKGIEEKDLSQLWLENLAEQFGDTVEVDPMFRHEWAYIPHIVHSPFYCYAYNFGELLSMALYARYKAEGKSFVPKVEAILTAGGSKDPDAILKGVGIDMASPEFWQGSFDLVKAWQDQLEKL